MPDHPQPLDERMRAFRQRFLQVASLSIGVISALVALITVANPALRVATVVCLIDVGISLGTYSLARRGKLTVAALVFIFACSAGITIANSVHVIPSSIYSTTTVFMLLGVLSALLLERRGFLAFCAIAAGGITVVALRTWQLRVAEGDVMISCTVAGAMFGLAMTCLMLFRRHYQESNELLYAQMADIDRVAANARRVAEGDLSSDIDGDSQVSHVLRLMLDNLRRMVARISGTVEALSASSNQIAAMAHQQAAGTVAQAAVVGEVRAKLQQLLSSAARVADSTDAVFGAVRDSQGKSELIADRARALADKLARIEEILVIIREVANKSEVLALNAALEGVRAGSAGSGFSLVAAQMQRLAENVSAAVKDVHRLTQEIAAATRETIESVDAGTALAKGATTAAHDIRLVTHEQRRSAEEAHLAMSEIASAAEQVATGSGDTLNAARQLHQLSDQLRELLGGFRLDSALPESALPESALSASALPASALPKSGSTKGKPGRPTR
jgi:hypothetical protein